MNPLLSALVRAGIISQADADRINRSMDPAAARLWAEQQLAIAVQSGLNAQQARLVDLVRRTNGSLSAGVLDDFWQREDALLWQAMRPTLAEIAAENAIALSIRTGLEGDMWRTVNETMLAWVDAYYVNADAAAVGSIPNLNLTSRTQFARAFAEWQRGELEIGATSDGIGMLIEAITPVFGPDRATTIAVTETTRVLQASGQAAADASDNLAVAIWQTAADEKVCEICGPMHMAQRRKNEPRYPNGQEPPAAHPNCRCREVWVTETVAAEPAPPEETYVWNLEDYQRAQREARQQRRTPSVIDTLVGG